MISQQEDISIRINWICHFDDSDRSQVNYSGWAELPFVPDNTQLGCLDESACNFSEDAIVDDGEINSINQDLNFR